MPVILSALILKCGLVSVLTGLSALFIQSRSLRLVFLSAGLGLGVFLLCGRTLQGFPSSWFDLVFPLMMALGLLLEILNPTGESRA